MQLDPKALIEEAVQASIDAGLAVNGEHGVAAARHAARFMFNALQAVQPVVTDGWQPIYTAPKDGTVVDLWCNPPGSLSTGPERTPDCWFYDGYWWVRDEQYGDEFNRRSVHNATHWMLKPQPPTALTATASAEPVAWQTEDETRAITRAEYKAIQETDSGRGAYLRKLYPKPLYAAPLPAQGSKADD
jgi:hypothetical protein